MSEPSTPAALRAGRGTGMSEAARSGVPGPLPGLSVPGRLPRGLGLVGGAYDGLSAALVERAGFDAVWAGGFSISASKLLPDCSVLTADELVGQVAEMTRAVRLPVVVDCDEGYGDLGTTRSLARRLSSCGAAGICIEDSAFPKLNSFCEVSGRSLATVDAFVEKLDAIRAVAPDLVLVARTESLIAGEPLDAALGRGLRYAEAGVDLVVVHSRFTTIEEFRILAEAWRGPVPLGVIPTLSEALSWRSLVDLGFGMVVYANQSLRASVLAQERVLRDIRSSEPTSLSSTCLASLEHLFELTDLRHAARRTGFGS